MRSDESPPGRPRKHLLHFTDATNLSHTLTLLTDTFTLPTLCANPFVDLSPTPLGTPESVNETLITLR